MMDSTTQQQESSAICSVSDTPDDRLETSSAMVMGRFGGTQFGVPERKKALLSAQTTAGVLITVEAMKNKLSRA